MAQSPSDHTDEMPLNSKLQAISSYKQATSLETPCVCPSSHAPSAAENNCDLSQKASLQLYDCGQPTHFKDKREDTRLDDMVEIMNRDQL